MYEMLSGGVRVQELVQRPLPIKYTESCECRLPTPAEEKADLEIDFTTCFQRLTPLNFTKWHRKEQEIVRHQQVYEFFQRQGGTSAKTKTPSKDLSILPAPQYRLKPGQRFTPTRIFKPMLTFDGPLAKDVRDPAKRLKGEIGGSRFHGERKVQSHLWQADRNSKDRMYYQVQGW